MAFQIRDDILDVISTTEELGKPVKSDEKNNKTTYVTIYGLDGASKLVEEYSHTAMTLLDQVQNQQGQHVRYPAVTMAYHRWSRVIDVDGISCLLGDIRYIFRNKFSVTCY